MLYPGENTAWLDKLVKEDGGTTNACIAMKKLRGINLDATLEEQIGLLADEGRSYVRGYVMCCWRRGDVLRDEERGRCRSSVQGGTTISTSSGRVTLRVVRVRIAAWSANPHF